MCIAASLLHPCRQKLISCLSCRPQSGELPIVGFCFSFPMKQQSVNHGTLIKWNKGFTNSKSVDEDPADMLTAALARQGMKVCLIMLYASCVHVVHVYSDVRLVW